MALALAERSAESNRKKAACAVVGALLVAVLAIGVGVHLASAAGYGGGTAGNPVVTTDLVPQAVKSNALARAKDHPIAWVNIKKGTTKVEWTDDGYYYRNAGWLSTTGEQLDLRVYITGDQSFSSSLNWPVGPDLKTGGVVNTATGQRWAGEEAAGTRAMDTTIKFKAVKHVATGYGTSQVACEMGMFFQDLDEPWEMVSHDIEAWDNGYGSGIYVGNSSTRDVVCGGQTWTYENYTHGVVYGSDAHASTPYSLTRIDQGGGVYRYSSNHRCGYNGGGASDETAHAIYPYRGSGDLVPGTQIKKDDLYYAHVTNDTSLGFLAQLPASGTFDLRFQTGDGSIGFDSSYIEPPRGYLKLKKTSSNTGTLSDALTPNFYNLKGAEFVVKCESSPYFKDGGEVGRFRCTDPKGTRGTTYCKVVNGSASDDDGYTLELPVGTYAITETIPAGADYSGYAPSSKTYKVVVSATDTDPLDNQKAQVVVKPQNSDDDGDNDNDDNSATLTVKNTPMSRLVVSKAGDEQGGWSHKLATYSRAGAQYTVYTDPACTVKAADAQDSSRPNPLTTRYELKSDSGTAIAGNGDKVVINPAGNEREAVTSRVNTQFMMLPPGTYYVKETKPSEGYALDSQVHAVTLTAGDLTVVDSAEPPVEDPIDIYKQDAAFRALGLAQYLRGGSSGPTPQGGATLDGARYEVRYYDGYYASAEEAAASGALQRTWELRTAYDGAGGAHGHARLLELAPALYNANAFQYREAVAKSTKEITQHK